MIRQVIAEKHAATNSAPQLNNVRLVALFWYILCGKHEDILSYGTPGRVARTWLLSLLAQSSDERRRRGGI